MENETGAAKPAPDPVTVPGQAAVEILTIGDELLLGVIADANTSWLCRRLSGVGIRVARCATVGDDVAAIREAVAAALDRTGTVVCTGGLGATADDLTIEAVAAEFGRELVVEPEVLEHIRRRFEARGLEVPDLSRQAQVPAGSRWFRNPVGLAPGVLVEDAATGRTAVMLPGVPSEMRALVDTYVLPWLMRRWPGLGQPIRQRLFRTTGITESAVADRVERVRYRLDPPFEIGYLPQPTGVTLRLTTWARLDDEDAERAFEGAEAVLRSVLGDHLYGRDDDTMAAVLGRRLTDAGLTLALAESCTGGLIGEWLTAVPGASAFLLGGVIAYANQIKSAVLGVDPATLATHGAVSEATALEMAAGAIRVFNADTSIAVTGIAGPSGGTPTKPVGTVWIATAVGEDVRARRLQLGDTRDEIRIRAAQAAMHELWRRVAE